MSKKKIPAISNALMTKLDVQSVQSEPNEPRACELWQDAEGRQHLILGNSVQEEHSIWSFLTEEERMSYMVVDGAQKVATYTFNSILSILETRAEAGCADSMRWCQCAYEGISHTRSV